MIAEGKKVLTDAIRGRTHVRRAGGQQDNFKREVSNVCHSRSCEHLAYVIEAHRKMERHIPVFKSRRKEGDLGTQHLLDEIRGKAPNKCFKCRRTKPTCNGARFCRFIKKEDSADVNSQESITEKFQVMK